MAREFWISQPGDAPIFEAFIANFEPSSISESDDYMDLKSRPCVHVIEYSAFEKLQAESQMLREVVKQVVEKLYSDNLSIEEFRYISAFLYNRAQDVLAKLGGKDEQGDE